MKFRKDEILDLGNSSFVVRKEIAGFKFNYWKKAFYVRIYTKNNMEFVTNGFKSKERANKWIKENIFE